MTRPDFYDGIHPQLDPDIAEKRRDAYMTKLEARLDFALDIVRSKGCSSWPHPETCATQTHGFPFKWCDTCKLLKLIEGDK